MLAITLAALMLDAASMAPTSTVPARPVPPAATLEQLSRRHHESDWLAVVTDSVRLVTRARRLDAQGLSGLTLRDRDLPHTDPLPWASMARIDRVTNRRTYGMIMGGVLVGLSAMIIPATHGENNAQGRYFVYGALAGAWIGGSFGSRIEREHVLYVAPAPVRAPAQPVTSPSLADGAAGAAAVTAAPAPIAASVRSSADQALIDQAVRRLRPGDLMRIDASFGHFQGYASSLGPEGLFGLHPDGSSRHAQPVDALMWERVYRIDKHASSAGKGAIHGAIVVGILGAVTGLAALGALSASGGGSLTAGEAVEAAVIGAGVGAASGALLGAGIGAAMPSWHKVYERR